MLNSYSYDIEIGTYDGLETLKISHPFTCNFNIKANAQLGTNAGTFTIYNLNESTREKIRKDINIHAIRMPINFYITKNNKRTLCFAGIVQECFSDKGPQDVTTHITAFDSGRAGQAISSTSYMAGTPYETIFFELIRSLKPYGVDLGEIRGVQGSLKRNSTFYGNTYQILDDMTDGRFMINNMRAYIIMDEKPIKDAPIKISAETGMIGVPRKNLATLQFQMAIEPRIRIWQSLIIDSKFNTHLNGNCKVLGYEHAGTISGSVANSVTTSIEAVFEQAFNIFRRTYR